jgi:uncharacterized membrane protein
MLHSLQCPRPLGPSSYRDAVPEAVHPLRQRLKGDPEVLPRPRDVALRTAFWVLPLAMTMGTMFIAALSIWFDSNRHGRYAWVPRPFRMSPDDARNVLSVIAGASITVVALVVSLTMVVLSLVATQFGPRIIRNFIRRRSSQFAIGAFVATFVYSITVLASIYSGGSEPFTPLVSTWASIGLVLTSTGLLVYYVHDLAFSVQTGNVLVGIASDLYDAIDAQLELAERTVASGDDSFVADWPGTIRTRSSGYLQVVHFDRLTELARAHDLQFHVLHDAGDFVVAGEPVIEVSTASLDEQLRRDAHDCLVLGAYRTMEQDIEFGVAQLVEIALRALSPAVNDPFTALMCIDWITDAIVRLSPGPIRLAVFRDPSGRARVLVETRTITHIIAVAYDQLRQTAADQPRVMIRLLQSIEMVAPYLEGSAYHAALRGEADAVLANARRAAPIEADALLVEAAYARAVAAFGGTP